VNVEQLHRFEMDIQRVLGVLAKAREAVDGGCYPIPMAKGLGMTPQYLRRIVRALRLTGTPVVVVGGRYKLPETDEEIIGWIRYLQSHQAAIWNSVKALKDCLKPGTLARLKSEGKLDENQMALFESEVA
jgi:hypothetical protein